MCFAKCDICMNHACMLFMCFTHKFVCAFAVAYSRRTNCRKHSTKTMHQASKKKASLEMSGSKLKIKTNSDIFETSDTNAPLKKFGLRGNQLCGSILIGNYDYLKELEVCENEMEVLDLSSLEHLEILTCNGNKLKELIINGKNLITLTAKYNYLRTMTVSPTPLQLVYLDISYNNFSELPSWTASCSNLRSLNAENNRLWTVAEFLSNYKINALHTLNIGCNNIRTLNILPDSFGSVVHLYLQSNELQKLPDNFFTVTSKNLRVFNASCNKLISLPGCMRNGTWCLEELFLSNNNLNDVIFDVLAEARKLRVLFVGYNKITELPEICIRSWVNLEVLVLSGNVLQNLPNNIAMSTKLEVLRVHSNLLLTTPKLSDLPNLKVLDLAHNHLDHINLLSIMPKNLKYLDLSCNLQLQVDEQQLQVCQSKKKWSFVDVSGKNRSRLPTAKMEDIKENNTQKFPWVLGFSETVGKWKTFFVSQLRLCNFRTDEGLFGMFESEESSTLAAKLASLIPAALQQERGVKETMHEYMKYTLLTAYQRLKNDEGCRGVAATLCHVARENTCFKDYMRAHKTKRYILRVASVGNIGAYLVRKTSNVCLVNAAAERARGVGRASRRGEKRLTIPHPDIVEVMLNNSDEYLIICNANIWAVMDIDRVIREVRKEENAVLAAKRVQDIAQSFGSDKNLSVIVIRFNHIGTDVDHLIKELKETVRKQPIVRNIVSSGQFPCCDHSSTCRDRLMERSSSQQQLLGGTRSDRSSPSGQSDQVLNLLNRNGEEYVLAHAQVLEEEDEMEMLDETDSALSEEQFKCWEYMLEQNTQLLFDKELNTISKSFAKNRNVEHREFNRTPDKFECKTNKLIKSFNSKIISTSSPHLLYNEVKMPTINYHQQEPQQPHQQQLQQQQKQLQVSFLSKHFGSSRSFQTSPGYSLFTSKSRNSVNIGPYSKICGGPNAAYFGSLQRLRPYNSENDFSVTQDRTILKDDEVEEDFSEHENRMRKYWGVATTEL